jgi:hypothetical protein
MTYDLLLHSKLVLRSVMKTSPLKMIVDLLLACVIVAITTQTFAQGSTIAVINTNDSGPGSLRQAIANATAGDTIHFRLTYPTAINLSSTLTIGTNLAIDGPGASNLAISGNNSVGVFVINPAITATISGITIENGSADVGGGISNFGTLTLSNCTMSGNTANNGGGGIFNGFTGATLTVINTTLSGNSAILGEAGGIWNFIGSTLTVNKSTFLGNSAGYGGGAIGNDGNGTVTNSALWGNSATDYGGAIFNTGALFVINSTLSGNSAPAGGGILNNNNLGSTLTVRNSTLSGNSATFGGGIFDYGPLTLTNSTLSGNSALYYGGGIFSYGTLNINNSTLSGNSASDGGGGGIHTQGALTAKNTIMASEPLGGNCSSFFSGAVSSQGHNLSDDFSCSSFLTQTGDLNNIPAGLDPSGLQNNGGPTKTIALLSGSPAVDAIPRRFCTLSDQTTQVSKDQRGVARPQGLACDIGAFEKCKGPIASCVTERE